MTNIKEKRYKSNLTGYLPMNFDLDKHLKKFPPDQVDGFDRDNLIYILSLITRIPARAERYDSEYVNIKAEYLYNRIPNYRQYLKYAIETGIIETDGHYRPGKKSTGYKFCDPFLTRVKGEPIIKYSLIKSDRAERERKNGETSRKFSYLTDHFNGDLAIDYDGAKNLLISNSQTAREYNFSLVHLDELKDQDFRYSVDQTAYRFHSNLTNLKSDFRQFITYGNETLVSVDLRNSQPFFSLSLLDKDFYENRASAHNFYSILSNISSISISPKYFNIPLMIGVFDNQDVRNYRELVKNGELYEYLAREIFDQHGITYSRRKDLKEDFFHGFYSPNQTIGQPEAHLRRLFRDRFPSVYKVFSELKRKDHRLLPILLQRIESYIVIERICPLIAQLRPNMVIYTIHDSVISTQGNEAFISAVMSEEIERITGHKPQLKIELWEKN